MTFLFTGVEGSIAIWERHPEAIRQALAVHDELVRSTIVAHGGRVFSAGGDGFAAAFDRAEPAARAAIAVQAALATATWPHDLELSVRMGLHSGEARERGGEFFGAAVNRASRVMDVATVHRSSPPPPPGSSLATIGASNADGSTSVSTSCATRSILSVCTASGRRRSRAIPDRRVPEAVALGNLPALAAQLVGRSDDVETVVAGLATARVATLTGVGGIGKTALALEVGRRLQPQAPDGVWLAALDTIERPDALLPLLLSLFGVDAWAVGDLDSLLDGLRFRETLLILDNCEHVLDAAADVATAIGRACPKVRVLATSREPLDVQGERVRRVPSLSVGDDGTAAALFRLRAEDAGTKLDPVRDADVVAQICCRLDGIPLAIELAAARTRSLRPAEIADRLDDMFRLLTGGKRAAAERHRTLRATLEWSYDLLSDAERVVLARLAAFSGSFGLDAAAWIVGGVLGDAGAEIVDLLDRLVARSLVVPIDDADETRFRLLEPVRQLAAENLAARGDAETTRARHTEWYLGLIDRLGVLWRTGSDQAAWPIAKRELPNLRTAFDHLVETARQDDAERFVVAAYGPIGCQFDGAPMYEWAPKARAIDPGHIGPFSASTCAIAALGAIPRGDFARATQWLRLGVDAIGAGSYDDGLVCCAAIHQVFSGGEPAVTRRLPRAQRRDRARERRPPPPDLGALLRRPLRRGGGLRAALGNRTLIALDVRPRAADRGTRRGSGALLGSGAGQPQLPDVQPRRARARPRADQHRVASRRAAAAPCAGARLAPTGRHPRVVGPVRDGDRVRGAR